MLKVNSARLLDLMLEHKLGVKDLSRLCGVSMAAVSSLLNGKRSQASIPTVARLADYFGVSPYELILKDKEWFTMKFEKFMVFNQDNEGIVETRHGEFTCGIAELHGLYVVNVVTVKDGYSYACGIYRDVQEAAAQVAELKDFAFKVDSEHQGFIFSVPEEPVTALEVIDALS